MTNQVPLVSPIKGIVRAVAREGQPPETCWDAQNVLPYDRYGRKRLAQRGGLLKQYPNQMSANFVQGMIEAPNIIYPPGTLGMPIFSITDLVDPFSFVTPGTTGPYPYTGPTFAFTAPWEWDFTVTFIQTVSVNSGDFGLSSCGCTAIVYWPLTNTAAEDLILLIGVGGSLGGGAFGPGSVGISAAAFMGDPSLSPGSWTHLGSNTVYDIFTGDATTGTISNAFRFQIFPNGSIKLFAASGSPPEIDTTYVPTIINFPKLNVFSVEVDPYPGGAGTTGCTNTISITD